MSETADTKWRVNWYDRSENKDGHWDVLAPTAYHAVWEVASGYQEEYIADMEFVSVEQLTSFP